MKKIKWLNEHLEEFILAALLIFIVSLMGIQILARYLFNNSLSWSEELTRYAFVWSAFISVSFCIKNQSSIKIEQVSNLFPKTVRKLIELTSLIIIFVFMGILLKTSFEVVQSAMQSGQKSAALRIPMYYVQMSSLVAFALAELRTFQRILALVREFRLAKVQDSKIIEEGA